MTSSFEPADRRQAEPEFVPEPIDHRAEFRPAKPAAKSADERSGGVLAADEPSQAAESELAEAAAALADAHQQGLEAGRAEASEALAPVLAALAGAAVQLDEQRSSYLRAQRGLLVELGIAIARRILEREIEVDPSSLTQLVARGLDELDEDAPVVVQLSATDHEDLEARGLCTLAEGRSGEVIFRARPDLAPGEARVLAGATTIDARLESILKRVRDELSGLEGLRAESAEGDA